MDLEDEGVEVVKHGFQEVGHGIRINFVEEAEGWGENICGGRRKGRGYGRDARVDFIEMLAESENF